MNQQMEQNQESKLRDVRRPMTEEEILQAVQLSKQGWSVRQIGKKLNHGKSSIHRWITIFAENIEKTDMRKKKSRVNKIKPRRIIGVPAPENVSYSTETQSESDKDKIKRLERELAEARLARDFYDEMINVAEKQFNINIRKKAGTRQ